MKNNARRSDLDTHDFKCVVKIIAPTKSCQIKLIEAYLMRLSVAPKMMHWKAHKMLTHQSNIPADESFLKPECDGYIHKRTASKINNKQHNIQPTQAKHQSFIALLVSNNNLIVVK